MCCDIRAKLRVDAATFLAARHTEMWETSPFFFLLKVSPLALAANPLASYHVADYQGVHGVAAVVTAEELSPSIFPRVRTGETLESGLAV